MVGGGPAEGDVPEGSAGRVQQAAEGGAASQVLLPGPHAQRAHASHARGEQ